MSNASPRRCNHDSSAFHRGDCSWVYAAYNGFRLLSHRKPDVAVSKLILSGMAWFNAENFDEAGRPYQRGLIAGFVVFFICVLVLMGKVLTTESPLAH